MGLWSAGLMQAQTPRIIQEQRRSLGKLFSPTPLSEGVAPLRGRMTSAEKQTAVSQIWVSSSVFWRRGISAHPLRQLNLARPSTQEGMLALGQKRTL